MVQTYTCVCARTMRACRFDMTPRFLKAQEPCCVLFSKWVTRLISPWKREGCNGRGASRLEMWRTMTCFSRHPRQAPDGRAMLEAIPDSVNLFMFSAHQLLVFRYRQQLSVGGENVRGRQVSPRISVTASRHRALDSTLGIPGSRQPLTNIPRMTATGRPRGMLLVTHWHTTEG